MLGTVLGSGDTAVTKGDQQQSTCCSEAPTELEPLSVRQWQGQGQGVECGQRRPHKEGGIEGGGEPCGCYWVFWECSRHMESWHRDFPVGVCLGFWKQQEDQGGQSSVRRKAGERKTDW